jgi:hypothetical protein
LNLSRSLVTSEGGEGAFDYDAGGAFWVVDAEPLRDEAVRGVPNDDGSRQVEAGEDVR